MGKHYSDIVSYMINRQFIHYVHILCEINKVYIYFVQWRVSLSLCSKKQSVTVAPCWWYNTPRAYARWIFRTLTGGAFQAISVERCLQFFFWSILGYDKGAELLSPVESEEMIEAQNFKSRASTNVRSAGLSNGWVEAFRDYILDTGTWILSYIWSSLCMKYMDEFSQNSSLIKRNVTEWFPVCKIANNLET